MANQPQIAILGATPADRPKENFQARLRRFLQRYPPLVMVSALFLLALIVVAVFAPDLSPFEYSKMDLRARLQAPVWMEGGTWKHMLGTDDLGRDVLSRLFFSIRVSLLVAFIGTI